MDERAKMRREYVGEGNPPEEELVASYRYLTSILESMLDAVIVANPDGTIRTVNRAALELLGYAEEEIIGQPVGTIFEEEEEEEEEEEAFFRGTGLARLVREGAARDVELTLVGKSGERIPVVFNGSVIREEDGRLSAVVGVARDIRERKRVEKELSVAYDALASSINGICIADLEGRIRYANLAFLKMFEYEDRDQVIGKRAVELFPSERVQRFSDVEAIIDRVEGETEEFIARRKDGTVFNVEVSSSGVTDNEGNEVGRMASFVDITERKRAEEEVERLAITDGLTGLYNHRHFYELLGREVESVKRYHDHLSLIMLDLDGFKAYNDTHGHLAGDVLLRELAQFLTRYTRTVDVVARYGGDEFAILLPHMDKKQVVVLAERLRTSIQEWEFCNQEELPTGKASPSSTSAEVSAEALSRTVTISLGVAGCPEDAMEPQALVNAADMALLEAKKRGGNGVCTCGKTA